MLLTDIQTKLEEVDSKVYYGAVDKNIQKTEWNYIVFDRSRMAVNTNKSGYSYYYRVHIIREDFIPEGLEISVIDKILEINGMRLASNDIAYEYVMKPNTNAVVEMATIEFVKPVKG